MLLDGDNLVPRFLMFACLLGLAFGSGTGPVMAETSDSVEAARAAALQIGHALRVSDLRTLRPHLPERGKVQVRLEVMGPADGFFSAGQVEALLGEFLQHGSVRSFDLLAVENQDDRYALARGRATLTDRDGRPARVELHLAFEPEGERWVLREIRETRP